jgi:hypothetical protein
MARSCHRVASRAASTSPSASAACQATDGAAFGNSASSCVQANPSPFCSTGARCRNANATTPGSVSRNAARRSVVSNAPSCCNAASRPIRQPGRACSRNRARNAGTAPRSCRCTSSRRARSRTVPFATAIAATRSATGASCSGGAAFTTAPVGTMRQIRPSPIGCSRLRALICRRRYDVTKFLCCSTPRYISTR